MLVFAGDTKACVSVCVGVCVCVCLCVCVCACVCAQLRPAVETFVPLVTQFKFDTSMFQRLAECPGFGVASLSCQGRMRPEFAELLLPIYPRLTSNLPIVSGNKAST